MTSANPGNSPSDRSRTCVTMVWMYTNGVDPKIPTARRRARFLGLGTAPESTFVDVPTTPWGKGDITSFHMRERPRGKLRLTALRGISLMNVMSAAQHHSSSFVHLTTAVMCLATARQTALSPR